ncbi:MAG: hypothetical protein CM15mP107_2210 [Bacteroidota bacterium]|nr:MAG: hypothetical protein CM15mP107_2210 [Bacteroidota bacterium]
MFESDNFAKEKLGREKAVGKIDMGKVNKWGGSLSIGHPFGATGSRLLTTASNRLHIEGGKYALIAACAAGAHGHAMIIKNMKHKMIDKYISKKLVMESHFYI